MQRAIRQSLFGGRFFQLFLATTCAAALLSFGGSNACFGDDDDNDADDGFYSLAFPVPAVPESFGKSGQGWGALVLQFNGPIERAWFEFTPACAPPTDGMIDDINSDNPSVQLGPGNYRLWQTGSVATSGAFAGSMYGMFYVGVEYEKVEGNPDYYPQVTSAFWQNKLTVQTAPNPRPRTWTFGASGDDFKDLMENNIPNPTLIPEPSSLVLAVLGIVGLVSLAWRKRKAA